ncbi:MAG TPA: hydroxyacid-oxoacid transhydrogenase [Gaiella sp.]|nr:hydroxyacid-oxoacid transhydrogenase [Gaiella sp.]
MTGGTATVVTFNAARVVFGEGASAETGEHLRQLGVTRSLVVCDRFVTESGLGERLEESLRAAGVEPVIYDGVAGEPNEASVAEAREAASGGFDGFVGVGGGSALDTAKLCALFATHGGELLDYVNAPTGAGRPVPGPVLPVVALPTTSGTGSEVTTVAIVDFPRLGTKTGVSHAHLRPSLAIVDPSLTVSCPPGVTAATGLDALMHSLEAYTVSAYDTRPQLPLGERPPYQGANPFSDPLCERAIELVGAHLRTAVANGSDVEARTAMACAATIAGIAFSGAGVHIPHALAYPIASLKHEWRPPGYGGAALVPHGFAVVVTAPAAFRFIADEASARCATAARLLDGGDDLAVSLERLMRDVGAPTTLSELGYGDDDLAALVSGAVDQRRLLVGAPTAAGPTELEAVLRASL